MANVSQLNLPLLDKSAATRREIQLLSADSLAQESLGQKCKIRRNSSGVPRIDPPLGKVSISHTRNHLALITNPHNMVAIDIEKIDRKVGKVKGKFTTDSEIESVGLGFPKNPEIFIWCAKECLFKILPFEGIHFKEQLSFKRFLNYGATKEIESEWSVAHPKFYGKIKIYSRTFDDLLISYIDE